MKLSQRKTNTDNLIYMQNLKKKNKIKTNPWKRRSDLWLPEAKEKNMGEPAEGGQKV